MKIQDFIFAQDPSPIPNDYLWERIRNWRNAELSKTDFTQLADSPKNVAAWAEYRQQLRDLPSTVSDPATIVFPEPPTA